MLLDASRKCRSGIWPSLCGTVFPSENSVYILEYPGYGNRKGTPSKESIDYAAKEAYDFLRDTYPNIPLCVAAESIGSGPASTLSKLNRPPEKLVLIVPFDKLSFVAEDHFLSFLVRLILKDNRDNVKSLSNYKGQVEIIGTEFDNVIPVKHAKALAAAIPGAKFTLITGGHNDWSFEGKVKIRD